MSKRIRLKNLRKERRANRAYKKVLSSNSNYGISQKYPILKVVKTNKYTYAQILQNGKTICTISDIKLKDGTKTERANKVGKDLADFAKSKGIAQVVFDKGASRYCGRIKSLADAARESGLKI